MFVLPTTLLTDYMDEKLIAQTTALYKLLSFYVTTSVGTEQFVDSVMWGGREWDKDGAQESKTQQPWGAYQHFIKAAACVLLLTKCFFWVLFFKWVLTA